MSNVDKLVELFELQRQLDKVEREKHKEFLFRIVTKYGLKIGDTVELITEKQNGNGGYDYDWETRVIRNFESDDKETLIWVSLKGMHGEVKIDDVKLYNENDYTLRNDLWDREMDLDDRFQLIVDKPNSTKGKIYSIEEVHKRKGCDIQYVYFNDDGQPQSLYEKEFHLTHK